MHQTNIALLILAAGLSRRMGGRDKLLEPVAGIPLLRHILKQAERAELSTWVTLAAATGPKADIVLASIARPVIVAEPTLGMSASIIAGICALPPGISAAMILPADMPEIDHHDLVKLVAAFRNAGESRICRATTAVGKPGHPVIFPARCFSALCQLSGDRGGASVIKHDEKPILHVPLPDHHATTDLDTTSDWAKWRSFSCL